MAIVTAMPSSFKSELFAGAHCFNATFTTSGSTNSSATVDSLASSAGIVVGMTIQETNGDLPAGTVVADIVTANSIRVYPVATASHAGTTLTFTGDPFKLALIRHAPTGTYDATSVNYTQITGNSDEVVGSGYAAGGLTLACLISGTTAYISFGGTVSWTAATIDADGCMIYNSNNRLGGTSGTNTTGAGRAVYVGDFGGRQTVTAGTFTIVFPTADATHAILRLQ
jgi:hypothetical protein